MKLKHYLSSLLLIAVIKMFSQTPPCPSGADVYKYRKEIQITNNNSSPVKLTDFQVKIVMNTSTLISSGKLTLSGRDIRFLNENGDPLSFWIDPDSFNSTNSEIWVKVDEMLASTTTSIYMFYGNTLVSSLSNGDDTFELFDDFNSLTIDNTKWGNTGASVISLQSGQITLTTDASTTPYPSSMLYSNNYSFDSETNPMIIESDVVQVENGYAYLGIEDASGNGWGVGVDKQAQFLYNLFNTDNIILPTDNDCRDIDKIAGIIPQSLNISGHWSFSRYSQDNSFVSLPNPTSSGGFYESNISDPNSPFNATNYSNDHRVVLAAFHNNLSSVPCTFTVDWVRARKYIQNVPVVDISIAEQELIDNVEATNAGPFCEGDDIELFSPTYSGATYTWSGPTPNSTLQNPVVSNSLTPSTYIYTVQVNGPTCSTLTATTSVEINPVTVSGAISGSSTVCQTSNSGSLNLSGEVGDVLYWEISNSLGGPWSSVNSTNTVQTYNGLTSNTYYRAVVQSGSCGIETTTESFIEVIPPSLGGNIIGSKEICSGVNGDSLMLINYRGNIEKWQYSTDNGTSWIDIANSTSSYSYPSITETTWYRVEIKNTPCSISYSDTAVIKVNPNPVADFENDTVCAGIQTTFTNNSSVVSGSITTTTWDFGSGSGSTVLAPIYMFPGSSNYLVSLEVNSDKGCVGFKSKTVPVYQNPVSSFTQNDVCDTIAMEFTNSTLDPFSDITYHWDFNDASGVGSSNAFSDTVYTFSSDGNFDVRLISVTSNGCRDTLINQVSVYPRATVSFIGDSVCFGDPINFVNTSQTTSSQITYLWNFGDFSSGSSLNSPSYIYGAPGNYFVTLSTVSPGPVGSLGCVDSLQKEFVIYPTPIASYNAINVCKYDSVYFENTTDTTIPNLTFNWDFDDGQFSNDYLTYHVFNSANNYTVNLDVSSDYGCGSSTSQVIEIYPVPNANFSFNKVCLGTPTDFSSTSSNIYPIVYDWNFDDGTANGSTNQVSHLYSVSDTFDVRLIITSAYSCVDTAIKSVLVNPLPSPNFVFNLACYGESTLFTDSSSISSGSINSFLWNFDDLSNSIDQNPIHQYMMEGTYNVNLSVTSVLNCTADTTIPVVVHPMPTANFTFTEACLFQDVVFNNTSSISDLSILNYHWDFSDGDTSLLENPQHAYNSFGMKSVKLIAKSIANCIDSVSKYVEVFPLPTVDAGIDTSVSQGFEVQLFGYGIGATNFSWSPSIGLNNNTVYNPLASPLDTTTYVLELTDVNGCQNTDSITINVIEDFKLFINNVVTPDNNGENDTWVIKNIETFELSNVYIYDRYGKEIYSKKGYKNDWDASSNFDQVPDGTYYYIINFDDNDKVYKGSITVLRN